MSKKCATLKVIIVMEDFLGDNHNALDILEKWGAQIGVKVMSFAKVFIWSETKSLGFGNW